jgi:hypothetical protein
MDRISFAPNIPLTEKSCAQCGSSFVPRVVQQRFCSKQCGSNCHNRRESGIAQYDHAVFIPSGTIGAIAELVVAADLMRRGHHVFRALSPSAPSDLVVLQDGKFLTVEVRTGKRNWRGKPFWGEAHIKSALLAVVIYHKDKGLWPEILYTYRDSAEFQLSEAA